MLHPQGKSQNKQRNQTGNLQIQLHHMNHHNKEKKENREKKLTNYNKEKTSNTTTLEGSNHGTCLPIQHKTQTYLNENRSSTTNG